MKLELNRAGRLLQCPDEVLSRPAHIKPCLGFAVENKY